jgi:20S proteasome subunit beta 7
LHRVVEFNEADGHKLGPNEIFEYLSQVMYARRSKFNPLWNSLVVGGYKDGKRWAQEITMKYWY